MKSIAILAGAAIIGLGGDADRPERATEGFAPTRAIVAPGPTGTSGWRRAVVDGMPILVPDTTGMDMPVMVPEGSYPMPVFGKGSPWVEPALPVER